MESERATGLVLRTHAVTDSSLLVHWLTAHAGRIKTVAKGARRPKSPFLGRLELFQVDELSFRRARSGELHLLDEAVAVETFPCLRTDYTALCQAAYAGAFVEQMTETDTPLDEVYQLMIDWLRRVSLGPARPRMVYAFELRLLDLLGLGADSTGTSLSPEAAALAETLSRGSWEEVDQLKPARDAAAGLRRFLQRFIEDHCQRAPFGRAEALGESAPKKARRHRP